MTGALAADLVLASFLSSLLEFLSPTTLLRVVMDGLAKAAIYVMLASGLTLIFGLMGVLNFAHGSLTMLGAYVGGLVMVTLVASATGPLARLAVFFVAIVVAFSLLAGVGGALEVSLIRPLYERPPLYQILLTFGLTLVIDEGARMVLQFYDVQPMSKWQAALGTRPGILDGTVRLLGLSFGISYLELFELIVGVLVVVGLWAFLTKTRYGLYIRAGSEDSEMAEALGIDIRRAFTVVFGVGVGIAGLAGAMLAWDPSWGASVPLGAEALLPAFVVVIVGGLGTFRGTVVAALIVGLVDASMTWWFQNVVQFAGLPELTIFLILVGTLILRPKGLYGVEEVGGH